MTNPKLATMLEEARARIRAREEEAEAKQREIEEQARENYEAAAAAWLPRVLHLIPEALHPYTQHLSQTKASPEYWLLGELKEDRLIIMAPGLAPITVVVGFIDDPLKPEWPTSEYKIERLYIWSSKWGDEYRAQDWDEAVTKAADFYPHYVQWLNSTKEGSYDAT